MLLIIEFFFIVLLVVILLLLGTSGLLSSKRKMRKATAEDCWSGAERRQHVRFKKNLEVDYIEQRKPKLNTNGKTMDISMGGMRLVVGEKFAKGAIVFIKVFLPELKKSVEAEGEVVWMEESGKTDGDGKRLFHAGVRFLRLKSPSDSHLLDYIRSLPQSSEA